MIIDDEIWRRMEYLFDFFTNNPLEKNVNLSQRQRDDYKEKIALEFDIVYPQGHEILDEYIKNNKVDAYFLDVFLEDSSNEWNLGQALTAISSYNPKAPIFMYSVDWKDKDVLEKVTTTFRNSFPGKTASYFYDLNHIAAIVNDFREAVNPSQIDKIKRERKFIKDMIVKAYGKTEKEPYSEKGDIVILHISDIQYGDSFITKYDKNLWPEVIRISKDLMKNKEIAGIDLLAITGDISMHGKSEEMKEAEEDLKQYLIRRLWEQEFENETYQERILLVPGNHDYDLNFCTLNYLVSENGPEKESRKIDFEKARVSLGSAEREIRSDYHTMGLAAYRDFAYNITGNPIYYQRKNLNYIENRYTSWNLRFVCLNTCDGICAEKTNGIGIAECELKEIFSENYDDELYTIVLSHHTPLCEADMQGEEKEKFHINCTSISNTCRANMWLGGHRHVQKDEIKNTSLQRVECYEAATISLKEEWMDDLNYEIETEEGLKLKPHRGFQIFVLEKKKDTYNPKVIKYIFDEEGVAHRVKG